MKIFIVSSGFMRSGGYRVLSNLASEWVDHGHEVSFVANYRSESPYFPTKADIIWVNDQGRKVLENSSHEKKPSFWLLRNLSSLKKALEYYVNDDAIVLYDNSLVGYSVLFARFKVDVKKFYYVQLYEAECYLRRTKFKVSDFVLFFLSSLGYLLPVTRIVNSPLYFKYKFCRSSLYVPPGIDKNIFFSKNIDAYSKIKRIGVIGRKEPYKGTDAACRLFVKLQKEFKELELYVAYNLPESFHDVKNITLVEPKNDRELAEFYRSCDMILALGTVQFGAPHYPVMEGMACGCVVVTTGYFPATETSALIVPYDDENVVESLVKMLVNNPGLAREKLFHAAVAASDLGWDVVAKKMLECFRT